MSLAALLASLFAQYAHPPPARQPLLALYGRLCLEVARRLNAGDRNSGVLAWCVLIALVLVPLGLAAMLAQAIHPVMLFLLETVVLYGTLRFLATTGQLSAIERLLREGDVAGAAVRLSAWQAEPVEGEDPGVISRLAAEQALREAHHGTFGLLFWYLLLPGPLGLALYPLAWRAARGWDHNADPEDRDFGWFAGRAFEVIDWVPQRVTAFCFAVVGNFEDALFCWRSQAAAWDRPGEGIVLASGAGALNVRLGDPIPAGAAFVARPPLGQGEPPREEALASLEGLLWRVLVLWLIVFLLAAAIHST